MLYNFLLSKKGYSFVEVMIVVTVLGILVAVGVPVLHSGYEAQAKKDCINQKTVVSAAFKEVMTGMMDNGKTQDKVLFSKLQSDHKITYPGDGVTGNADDAYVGKECFPLIYDQGIPGKIACTIGDIRGGYFDQNAWNSQGQAFLQENGAYDEYNPDKYTLGCEVGYYLKKLDLKDVEFYMYLTNEEIPVCPFADFENNKDEDNYRYYIFEDGTVMCSCPKCNEN